MDSDTPTPKAWDGTPLQKANFYVSGRRLLFDQVKGARLFLTHGTLVSDRHGKQAVINVAHAQDLIDGTLPEGTITPLAPFDALKHYKGKAAREQNRPQGTPAPGTPAPPVTRIIPTSIEDLGPDGHEYYIAPKLLLNKDEEIFRFWADHVTNRAAKERMHKDFELRGTLWILSLIHI